MLLIHQGSPLKVMLGDKSVDCYSCGMPRIWTGITGNAKVDEFKKHYGLNNLLTGRVKEEMNAN